MGALWFICRCLPLCREHVYFFFIYDRLFWRILWPILIISWVQSTQCYCSEILVPSVQSRGAQIIPMEIGAAVLLLYPNVYMASHCSVYLLSCKITWEEILSSLRGVGRGKQRWVAARNAALGAWSEFQLRLALKWRQSPAETCPPDWAVFLGLNRIVFLRVQNKITRNKQKTPTV